MPIKYYTNNGINKIQTHGLRCGDIGCRYYLLFNSINDRE